MPLPAARLHRHFLAWDRPWLPQAAAWLGREWTGSGPLDLSGVLTIVPTRQSGRRLREALAEFAAKRNSAVFPPRTHTPDTLLASGAATPDVASRLESLLAWTEVLRDVDLAAVPEVFPVAPPRRDFAWAWRIAESFIRLQSQLSEGGVGFAEVDARAGADFVESRRWRQLAELERMAVEILRARGRREPHEARREYARHPAVPAGIRRVVVLGSPDPLPSALDVLNAWAALMPVEILIFGPAGESDAFDAHGRPLPAAWERREIPLTAFERRVRLCSNPAAEAEHAAVIARSYAEPDGMVAFGLADPEVLPLLENELSRVAIPAFNPEGRTRRSEAFDALLTAFAALVREPTFEALAALARCPDFLVGLKTRFGPQFSSASFLAELDELWSEHLPADLATARAAVGDPNSSLARGLAAIEDVRLALTRESAADFAASALTLVFGQRRFNLAVPDDARTVDAAEAWRQVMRECTAARGKFPGISSSDWWDLALRMYGDERSAEEKPAGALELQGWLELLWEDAPHLVVVGLNDGLVPDAITGDPFLPESLREKLGLKTNAARFARDAYMLHAMAASRARHGRLDLLFAKESGAGDSLRPSRLLLHCADSELPARVAFLFRAVGSTRPNVPWTRAWQLTPRREPPPVRVPVTGLRKWLECPFRFYLAHVLRMESVNPAKSELDALDFGILCHAALEAMSREPALQDCTDEAVIREFLLQELDRVAGKRYGENLTLPLVVQLESARQRLARVAALQARERAAGWRTEHVETGFSLDVGGLEVRGKIDRIDRHEVTGEWRVLDYKTTDAAPPPHKTHLRPFRSGDESRPDWARVPVGAGEQVWADLQLPVYLRAWAREVPAGSVISCGYINLPKAAGDTALVLWNELDADLLTAANACTNGVAAAIRAGEFWPPAEIAADRDAFASLFHHGTQESVVWEVAR